MFDPVVLEGFFIVADAHDFGETRSDVKSDFDDRRIFLAWFIRPSTTAIEKLSAREVTEVVHSAFEVENRIYDTGYGDRVCVWCQVEPIAAGEFYSFAGIELQQPIT